MFPVAERWKTILRQVKAPAKTRLNGQPATLIAVSKGQPVEAIEALLKEGQRDFGENRVQEAAIKWPALKEKYPGVRLHLIGGLQTNKARQALALFDAIHTVDRPGLADALMEARDEGQGAKCSEFFVQVNTGEEAQKGGVLPQDLAALMHHILAHRPSPLVPLPVVGLMCIPPLGEPPAPHFALLRKQAQDLGLRNLSMGMSGDYETALRLGATHVRIGTALFGERAA